MFGLLADLVGFNRLLIEGVLERVRRLETSGSHIAPDDWTEKIEKKKSGVP